MTGDDEVVEGEIDLLPECGQRGCRTIARTGAALCDVHTINNLLAASRRRLVEATPRAVEIMIDLSENASNEEVRRKATADVMDRAGLSARVEVDVVVAQAEVSPGDVLRERLATIRRRTLEGATEAGN